MNDPLTFRQSHLSLSVGSGLNSYVQVSQHRSCAVALDLDNQGVLEKQHWRAATGCWMQHGAHRKLIFLAAPVVVRIPSSIFFQTPDIWIPYFLLIFYYFLSLLQMWLTLSLPRSQCNDLVIKQRGSLFSSWLISQRSGGSGGYSDSSSLAFGALTQA